MTRSNLRLLLIGVVFVGAVVAAATILTLDEPRMVPVFASVGYWGMLIFTGLVILALAAFWRSRPKEGWMPMPRHEVGTALATCLALSAVIHATDEHGFKILWDEASLSAAAMGMHYDQEAVRVDQVRKLGSGLSIVSVSLDKRPLFFPFLISVVHGATGYRATNGVWLNFALTPVLFWLAYLWGRLAANHWAGLAAMILLAGIPLVSSNLTGGGFETLNLVLILGAGLAGYVHWRYATTETFSLLVALVCAAAHTRYESLLFMAPVGGLAALVAMKRGRIRVSWIVVGMVCLLLLLPMQWRIFQLNPRYWEFESRAGADAVFSIGYIAENAQHAFRFLFAPAGAMGGSMLVAILGILGVAVWLVDSRHVISAGWRNGDGRFPLWVFHAALFGHGLVMLAYFYGQFDDPIVSRLALPLLMALVLAAAVATARVAAGSPWCSRFLLAAAVVQFVGVSRTAVEARLYQRGNATSARATWLHPYLDEFSTRNVLVIDRVSQPLWPIWRVPAVSSLELMRRPDDFAYHFEAQTWDAVYCVEVLWRDPASGRLLPHPETDFSEAFELEELSRMSVTPLEGARLCRIVRLKPGGLARWAERQPKDVANASLLRAMPIDADFVQRWQQRLP